MKTIHQEWLDDAVKQRAKFDAIRLSFYPGRKDWQTESGHCIANITNLIETYRNPVMVCEIGFYASEPQITKALLVEMIKTCEAIPGHLPPGLFYWEPEFYTEDWARSAWQANGRPTIAMDVFSIPADPR